MFKPAIDYLNLKVQSTGFFNQVNCLAEKIEREGSIYPALCNGNEYKRIDLDPEGSVCYWRKNGDINIAEEENITNACNVQYKTTIPLKFVGFLRKDSPYNDCYFSDNIIGELISVLTTTNSALKKAFKAKTVIITATKWVSDPRTVVSEEYDNINFEIRYTHSYFSIDFTLSIVSNQNCFNNICSIPTINTGFVQIVDQDGVVIAQVPCGGNYSVLVFSGIDGGNATTVYTNQIVDDPRI